MLINSEDLKGHMTHLFFANYFSVSLKLDSPSPHSLYIDGVAKILIKKMSYRVRTT